MSRKGPSAGIWTEVLDGLATPEGGGVGAHGFQELPLSLELQLAAAHLETLPARPGLRELAADAERRQGSCAGTTRLPGPRSACPAAPAARGPTRDAGERRCCSPSFLTSGFPPVASVDRSSREPSWSRCSGDAGGSRREAQGWSPEYPVHLCFWNFFLRVCI